jgi:prepilin-type N-terminal cleavage/methylation domain-containing protein
MAREEAGYTLVELVVVILIFGIAMTLISVSFRRIVGSSAQIVKAAETDIGGLIGLELMRCDLELAGMGLPWALPGNVSYVEGNCPGGCTDLDDAPNGVPRAIALANNTGCNGSDRLALKGTALGMSPVSRSWSYLLYSSGGTVPKPSKSELELKPGSGDRVIVLKTGALSGTATRELVAESDGNFTLFFTQALPAAFRPQSRQDSYLVYGVAPVDSGNSQAPLEFPFNRADYYLAARDQSATICAHVNQSRGTGTLLKAVQSHSPDSSQPAYYPILDCVADLQVNFLLDTNGDGEGDYVAADLSVIPNTAGAIREQVKEIRVYILAQQGRRDASYLYPVSDPARAIVVGDPALDPALGSVWSQSRLASDIAPDWRNYHWKVYTIVVRPKNL